MWPKIKQVQDQTAQRGRPSGNEPPLQLPYGAFNLEKRVKKKKEKKEEEEEAEVSDSR